MTYEGILPKSNFYSKKYLGIMMAQNNEYAGNWVWNWVCL